MRTVSRHQTRDGVRGRLPKSSPKVFFGTQKSYLGTKYNTLWISSIVMLFTVGLIIAALQISLRRQLTKV